MRSALGPGAVAWIEGSGEDGVGALRIATASGIRTASARGALGPSTSPGGRWVTVTQDTGSASRLVLHRADGSRAPQVALHDGAPSGAAHWSRDGRRFTVIEQDARARSNLVVCDAESLHCARWRTDDPELVSSPILSPDGRLAAFTSGWDASVVAYGADRRRHVLLALPGGDLGEVTAWTARGPVLDVQRKGRGGFFTVVGGRIAALGTQSTAGRREIPALVGPAPDGLTLHYAGPRGVVRLDGRTGARRVVLRERYARPGGVLPDGRLAAATFDEVVVQPAGGGTPDVLATPAPDRLVADISAG